VNTSITEIVVNSLIANYADRALEKADAILRQTSLLTNSQETLSSSCKSVEMIGTGGLPLSWVRLWRAGAVARRVDTDRQP
jgi:hypothetical protein